MGRFKDEEFEELFDESVESEELDEDELYVRETQPDYCDEAQTEDDDAFVDDEEEFEDEF